jgi:methyltransferase (TIGR00027 family)
MKAHRSSKTAEAAAAARAVATLADSPKLFDDPYAIKLTSAGWRLIVRNPPLRWLIFKQFYDRMMPGAIGFFSYRLRYAEDRLRALIEQGVTQYVILGAGFDSFALRDRALLDRISVFELDHPLTQETKRFKIKSLGMEIHPNHHFIPIDFETTDVDRALSLSPFCRGSRSFISWLGVSFYIRKQVGIELLNIVARWSAKGSEIVFDYVNENIFDQEACCDSARRCLKFVARRGEPWITGFDPSTLGSTLDGIGWRLQENLGADDQATRYPRDNILYSTAAVEFAYIARATVA